MRVRRAIHIFLVVFGSVLAGCFTYGAYLMHVQRTGFEARPSEVVSTQTVDELVRNADRDLQNKHIEQALIAYRKALTMAPDSIQAQLGVAQGELTAGRESVAAQEYERALRLDRQNVTALRQAADIYSHQHENWPRAESKYKEYLELKPDDVDARVQLGRVLAWQRKSKEAVEIFSAAAVAARMTSQDQKDYAFALVRAGHDRDAEKVLRKLIIERRSDFEVQEQLAALYASRKDWDAALPLYESLLIHDPDNSRWNLTYGVGLLAARRYQAAIAPLEKARLSKPSSADAGLALARAWKGTGNLKTAAQEFGHVLPQYRTDSAVLREYADLLLEKRDYRGAEKAYKGATALGLRDTRLVVGLAGALAGSGKYRESLPLLREAYSEQPNDRLAFELARTLKKLGRSKEALEVLARIDQAQR